MVKIKGNCSTSGKHGFSLTGVFDEQCQDFVHNFGHGQKPVCYLGALAIHRGKPAKGTLTIPPLISMDKYDD
jgi:hypothetical protein